MTWVQVIVEMQNLIYIPFNGEWRS